MTDTAIIFVGPTISVAQIRNILPDAVCLPPVAQGDIVRALRDHKPYIIGIIDGYFGNVPAVWHKEIMFAMAGGVHVLGAASMGALRAAELHDFGMEGVGRIFESFKSGLWQDDDEVAITHGAEDSGYLNLSESMANIRATMRDALAQGVISDSFYDELIACAKGTHFRDRHYPDILAGFKEHPERTAFEGWLQRGRRDIKKEDALLLLDRIAQMRRAGISPKQVSYELSKTAAWLKTVNQAH